MTPLLSCDALADLCLLYWAAGGLLYAAKFVSPRFDRLTSFGKLRAAADADSGWSMPHSAMFTLFYACGLVFVAGVLALRPVLPCHPPASAALQRWLFALLAAHLLRRLLECLFVHRFSLRRTPVALAAVGAPAMAVVRVRVLTATRRQA
jgi:hypothetical protein